MSNGMTTVACSFCGTSFQRETKEVRRSLRRGFKHYCKVACQSASRIVAKEGQSTCARCGDTFITKKHRGKWSIYCSRSCASASNVTESRREAARKTGKQNLRPSNLTTAAELMKKREAWKYAEIAPMLQFIRHEFEFPLESCIFDLCLFDSGLLVEFDGKDYNYSDQIEIDGRKEAEAKRFGYKVLRIQVDESSVVPLTIGEQILGYARTTGASILDKTRGQYPPGPPKNVDGPEIASIDGLRMYRRAGTVCPP